MTQKGPTDRKTRRRKKSRERGKKGRQKNWKKKERKGTDIIINLIIINRKYRRR